MNRIKEFRELAVMTQEALANELGLSQGAVAHYENGKRTPDLDVCRNIVSVFIEKGLTVTLDDVFPPKEKAEQQAFSALRRMG